MLEQADDLRAEGEALFAVLETLAPAHWERPTPFKQWTVNDVMWHLHSGDWLAVIPASYSPEPHERPLRLGDADRLLPGL